MKKHFYRVVMSGIFAMFTTVLTNAFFIAALAGLKELDVIGDLNPTSPDFVRGAMYGGWACWTVAFCNMLHDEDLP